MFRQPLRSRADLAYACLAVAFGLTLFSPLTWAQDRSPYERLDRLERDLNMLQRHVYRGAPGYAPDSGGAVDAQLRMDRLEAQMRELTGRVEEYANRLEQLRRRVEQLNGDVEHRFSEQRFNQGAGPGSQGPVAAAAPSPVAEPARPPRPARPATTPERSASYEDERGPSPGGPTPIFGTLTPPGSPPAAMSPAARPEPPRSKEKEAASAAAAPAAAGNGALTSGALPGGSATEQYNHAFGLMKQANYPAAEAAFKEFVEAHPKDQMAGNAQYWLGETFYARGKYMEAASAFAEGYKRYPKSSKASDALLKMGMSLARADQKQNACVALAKLGEEFPQAASSVKQRAAAEMKKLGC